MTEKTQVIFMQVRLIRLASETWNMPAEEVVKAFHALKVFDYIEAGYGIFHCEGDEAILEDISEFMARKGWKVNAYSS